MGKYLRAALFFCFVLIAGRASAGNKIKVYFNHPVNNAVSTGTNAVYSNHIADTVVAYINRAKYTIDVAMYSFIYSANYANIAAAMDSAVNRGVKIRWIYEGSSSQTGMANLNPVIDTFGRYDNGSAIMHNKVMIIDANSADPNDAVVYTGSMNWTVQQFNTDYNNVLFIQDSALAHAYTDEFNMMWGGTGLIHNAANAKFGPHKTDLGHHNFTIDGHQVELYFSPSDNTNTHIINTINTANTDLYFAIYTFTYTNDASAIVGKKNAGVYVAGIDDAFSDNYTPYILFTSNLDTNFISYHGTGIYHNKYMIVDPSDKCSDPIVETGSHNWSSAANTDNDENAIMIHSDTLANVYYQSFNANFTAFGGTLASKLGCGLSVKETHGVATDVNVYPNPLNDASVIAYTLNTASTVTIRVTNLYGQTVALPVNNMMQQAGSYTYNFNPANAGIYFVQFHLGNDTYTQKVVKLN